MYAMNEEIQQALFLNRRLIDTPEFQSRISSG